MSQAALCRQRYISGGHITARACRLIRRCVVSIWVGLTTALILIGVALVWVWKERVRSAIGR
jgi:hypothetical protein